MAVTEREGEEERGGDEASLIVQESLRSEGVCVRAPQLRIRVNAMQVDQYLEQEDDHRQFAVAVLRRGRGAPAPPDLSAAPPVFLAAPPPSFLS